MIDCVASLQQFLSRLVLLPSTLHALMVNRASHVMKAGQIIHVLVIPAAFVRRLIVDKLARKHALTCDLVEQPPVFDTVLRVKPVHYLLNLRNLGSRVLLVVLRCHFGSLDVLRSDRVPVRVVDGSPLSHVVLVLLHQARYPIHLDHLPNVLLFHEALLRYLKFMIAVAPALTEAISPHAALEAAAEEEVQLDHEIGAIVESELFSPLHSASERSQARLVPLVEKCGSLGLLIFVDEAVENFEHRFVLNKLLIVREYARHDPQHRDKKPANVGQES